MTVKELAGRFNLHHYSKDVGVSATANDAAFEYALQKRLPVWLEPNRVYDVTQPVDMRALPSPNVSGACSRTTQVRQTTPGLPVFQVGDSPRTVLENVQINHTSQGLGDIGVEVHGAFSQSTLEDLFIYQIGSGIVHAQTGALPRHFSNTFQHLRVTDFRHEGISMAGSSGTGSQWSDIYINNADPGSFDPVTQLFSGWPCNRAFHVAFLDESSFDQINIEYINPTSEPVLFQGCKALTVQSMHVEGVKLPADLGLVSLFSDQSNVKIQGLTVTRNTILGGSNSSIFTLGPDTRLRVETMMTIFNNNGGNPFLVADASGGGPGLDRQIHVVGHDDATGDMTGAYDPARLGDSEFREYNDEWRSLVEVGQVYRVSIAGGVLQAVPV